MAAMSRRIVVFVIALMLLPLLAGCAHSPPEDPWDPLEPVNRKMHSFNMTMDRYLLRPVAKGYDKVTPERVQTSVGNFFGNLYEPVTIVNSLLQGKMHRFSVSLFRFITNTTVGVVGLFDVAGAMGVEDPREDLGQTLGYWGLGQGVYLELPFLGPSTGRDIVGRGGDLFLNPLHYVDSWAVILSLHALRIVDTRAGLLPFDRVLEQQFDPYVFIRSYYLRSREAAVNDEDDAADDEPAADEMPF